MEQGRVARQEFSKFLSDFFPRAGPDGEGQSGSLSTAADVSQESTQSQGKMRRLKSTFDLTSQ